MNLEEITPILFRIEQLCFQFAKKSNMNQHVASVHKRRSHSNVTFVSIAVLETVNWKDIFYQFMKESSHSNGTFVAIDVQKKGVTWINMLHQFMKKRSLLNVTFATTNVHKRVAWIDILQQFIKEKDCELYWYIVILNKYIKFVVAKNQLLSW